MDTSVHEEVNRMADRRASSVAFGFDFQVNAAIVLMVERMTELKSLRLEGNHEDIEITTTNGDLILAQAKAVEKASSDFRNVLRNLRKAIVSLSDGSNGVTAKQLIFVTNSPNPLNETPMSSTFYAHAHRTFSDLPESSQEIIRTQYEYAAETLAKDSITPIDINQLHIQVIPFETDNDDERYKIIKQVVDDFVGSLDINIPGMGKRLLKTWQNDIFINCSKKNPEIVLNKQDIIWPMVVFATDIQRCDNEIWENYDPAIYEEVVRKYGDTINSACEKFEFFTKVLSDYSIHPFSGSGKKKANDFIENHWQAYRDDFQLYADDPEVQQALVQIILHNILKNRIVISNIKKGVNL